MTTAKKPSVIAIDGPAAAGKTTLALALAQRLGYLYFDTGVMYRAVTLAALERQIDLQDHEAVASLAESVVIDVLPADGNDHPYRVLLDGEDVTARLRTTAIDRSVSIPSAYAGVRQAMTRHQRRIAERGSVVMVGRDIGTVVIPEAGLKLFLVASVEERARRRWEEACREGRADSYEDILADMRQRDERDASRDVAPLRPADDAIVVDTTKLDSDAVLDLALALALGP
ncbi:MAG: (d)CMP kinase [Anaerolineae bacterium]